MAAKTKKSRSGSDKDSKHSESKREKDFQVLIRPIITEKSSVVGQMGTCVTFEVDRKSSKTDISGAVQRIYGVTVEKVRTLNFLGKVKRRGQQIGRNRHYKKAYVTLAPGSTIDVVEGL